MTPHQRLLFDSVAAAMPALVTIYLTLARFKPTIVSPKFKQLANYDQLFSTQFLAIFALLSASFLADVVVDILVIRQGAVSPTIKMCSFVFTAVTSIVVLILAYRLFMKKRS